MTIVVEVCEVVFKKKKQFFLNMFRAFNMILAMIH
jgi:hypothetical protein